jgi:nucleoside phosphorylase
MRYGQGRAERPGLSLDHNMIAIGALMRDALLVELWGLWGRRAMASHPRRKEIARYLLSRTADLTAAAPHKKAPLAWPKGLAPTAAPLPAVPDTSAPLPSADAVIVTWTADEVKGLADVLTPGQSPVRPKPTSSAAVKEKHWYVYDHNVATFLPQIRAHAPAANSHILGSYFPITIGKKKVLLFKSELHLNQDGIEGPKGFATLPVKDLFKQIIDETKASHVLTTGTAGSVFDDFELGDVVVTRAAQFMCTEEFKNEPYNGKKYKSTWTIPTAHFEDAQTLMATMTNDLRQPPVGPPSPDYPKSDELAAPPPAKAAIRLDGRDMKAFHPILTTDYFEYGTTVNRLDKKGAGVEMGDAALGLACSEMQRPPKWAVVRNMSDPVINGALPGKRSYHLNEQTTWAVAYYTAYGLYTSKMSALACWAIMAGL